MTDGILGKKWELLLKKARPFRFVPFVEFVLVAGSMATGKAHEKSDFDVIVGARAGRIWSARFFSAVVMELFGYRRKGSDHKEDAADMICLNHFVTQASYRLGGERNAYWDNLYSSLVPIIGDEDRISEFFKRNDWMEKRREYKRDARYIGRGNSIIKKILEAVLSGKAGDLLECTLGNFQTRRIERGLSDALGYKPQVVYTDEEIRFHVDTRRAR